MDVRRYYVSLHTSVGTIEIRDEKGDATYDFELEATPSDIELLEKYVRQAREADLDTFKHPHFLPFTEKVVDQDHAKYDQALGNIYQLIYQLGTPETKQQVEQMGVLHALEGNPWDRIDLEGREK